MYQLILASGSPRRREILQSAGFSFRVVTAGVDEIHEPGEAGIDYVRRLAHSKAMAIDAAPRDIILGADTTVELDGELLEKPADAADAARMLRRLSGRLHQVHTGICLASAEETVLDVATTEVTFAPLTAVEIDTYIASGEPFDKAGGYGIQGLASKFIERIDGCYFNVMGLPIALFYRHWRRLIEG